MELIIDKVIDAVLEASGIKEKVGRNQHVLRLLRRFGLDNLVALTSFEDIYAYALVEYAFDEAGECKPKPLVQFFKAKEVRELFQAAYHQNDPENWLRKGEEIAQFKLGNDLPELEPKRELGIFAAVFIEVVKQTRSPKEIRQEQKLDRLQRQLTTLQTQLQTLPTLEAINQQINQLTGTETSVLPAAAQNSQAVALARQLGEWFEVLEYDREPNYEVWETNYFEWIINFPITRRKFSRILVRGVTGEVSMADLQEFQKAIKNTSTDEGWVVSYRRVSKAARTAAQQQATYADITCYTFDELLDEDADFSRYLEWLEEEIKARGIDAGYIPLSCRKDELSPNSQQKIGVSIYGEEDGWIDGYVDQWLADPAKEHLSVLGEFGTGKTWFALHYAWVSLQRYQDAKKRGIERPRVPIVIPLRDYAKAVTVESLLSEFFFREHEILKNYSIFEQLNRMGKLLLIFDGFDEMAARVNQQAMIDNFWELSKVVIPGAKAILTCRTEHFPDAIAGRQLLNAELQASTKNLTGEPPQFEVLELEKFSDEQIAVLLRRKAQENTVSEVMSNLQLLDLARRPVMVDLILEALPEIEAGKPVDMARIYLYAVTAKMERDIKSERTFTSLADKLYFLCELSWAMLSTNQMSLNYQAFPEQLEQLFADRVKKRKELDHWRYDMMGQTMLIRNSEGDYSPAHRSLLEFFAAYKIVASLGAMAEDFAFVARQQSFLNNSLSSQGYTWSSYFRRECIAESTPYLIAPLAKFETEAFEELLPLLGPAKLDKAVLALAHPMLAQGKMREQLLPLLWLTRRKESQEIGYFGGNIAQLMLAQTPYALLESDLSRTKLKGVDFTRTYLRRVNLQGANLSTALFSKAIGTVNSLVFNRAGDCLIIGDTKGSIQVWNAATGQVNLFCLGHSNWIRAIALSPDGNTLASASDDKTLKLWSVESGNCIRTLVGHSNWVRSVAFNPDGKTLASASGDKTIKLWSVETGNCLSTLKGHSDWVLSVAFSPDGKTLASGSYDQTVKLWSMVDSKCIQTLAGHSSRIRSVTFSPDGRILASGGVDQVVKLWSMANSKCIRTLKGHTDWVLFVTFSPDGQLLATSSDDKTIKLWSVDSGICIHTLEGHSSWIRSIAFTPDSQILASGSEDKTVKLWSAVSGDCIRTFEGHPNWARSVAFSPDGETLATGSEDKTVRLWSMGDGNYIHTLEGHSARVRAVTFSPDGQILASCSADQTIKLWSMINSNYILTLQGHSSGVLAITFSPDGQTIASCSDDQTVKLWSIHSGNCIQTLKGHNDWVLSVAFAPDGKILASGSEDKTIRLWSVASGHHILTLEGHDGRVRVVAFSPDNQVLASGSADQTVKLWSIHSGSCIQTFQGHSRRVVSIAFSPDGKTLASSSEDKMIKLWSISTGNCLYTFQGHSSEVVSVAFSSDGKTLASGSDDETIRLWNVKTGECLRIIDEQVCAGMNITDVIGLTVGQRTALKLMGAIDQNDEAKNLQPKNR